MMGNDHGVMELMERFAERTGLTGGRGARRYLWTDAFAVCNFLALGRRGAPGFEGLARRLIDQVHGVLGRHRGDDGGGGGAGRGGWLSGLGEDEGAAHPTLGGLRIGKPLPERGPGEPLDRQREWERDGQYFHYLTKWMHALDQMSRVSGEARYNVWGRELAAVAQRAFTVASISGGRPRMVWKMRTDLSGPLVTSMGHHDPLDGYVTCRELRATRAWMGIDEGPDLDGEAQVFGVMVAGRRDWATPDPLGIGGLLMDALRLAQLIVAGASCNHDLLDALLEASAQSLRHYQQLGALGEAANHRLAFRELGLAIGLGGVAALGEALEGRRTRPGPRGLEAFEALRASADGVRTRIVAFWRASAHRETHLWKDHQDINDVMLATALMPEGFLALHAPERRGQDAAPERRGQGAAPRAVYG